MQNTLYEYKLLNCFYVKNAKLILKMFIKIFKYELLGSLYFTKNDVAKIRNYLSFEYFISTGLNRFFSKLKKNSHFISYNILLRGKLMQYYYTYDHFGSGRLYQTTWFSLIFKCVFILILGLAKLRKGYKECSAGFEMGSQRVWALSRGYK